jgi:large subunit ribosomal protein L46
VSEYITKSGILLSRPPLLTKPPTAFEKSFFFYQKRLNERLVMPFSRYFYFKKDTPADTDWKIKARERGGASQRELGGYQAYGEEAWNDELLVGPFVLFGVEGEWTG